MSDALEVAELIYMLVTGGAAVVALGLSINLASKLRTHTTNSLRPILIVVRDVIGSDKRVRLRNIGKGPARLESLSVIYNGIPYNITSGDGGEFQAATGIECPTVSHSFYLGEAMEMQLVKIPGTSEIRAEWISALVDYQDIYGNEYRFNNGDYF